MPFHQEPLWPSSLLPGQVEFDQEMASSDGEQVHYQLPAGFNVAAVHDHLFDGSHLQVYPTDDYSPEVYAPAGYYNFDDELNRSDSESGQGYGMPPLPGLEQESSRGRQAPPCYGRSYSTPAAPPTHYMDSMGFPQGPLELMQQPQRGGYSQAQQQQQQEQQLLVVGQRATHHHHRRERVSAHGAAQLLQQQQQQQRQQARYAPLMDGSSHQALLSQQQHPGLAHQRRHPLARYPPGEALPQGGYSFIPDPYRGMDLYPPRQFHVQAGAAMLDADAYYYGSDNGTDDDIPEEPSASHGYAQGFHLPLLVPSPGSAGGARRQADGRFSAQPAPSSRSALHSGSGADPGVMRAGRPPPPASPGGGTPLVQGRSMGMLPRQASRNGMGHLRVQVPDGNDRLPPLSPHQRPSPGGPAAPPQPPRTSVTSQQHQQPHGSSGLPHAYFQQRQRLSGVGSTSTGSAQAQQGDWRHNGMAGLNRFSSSSGSSEEDEQEAQDRVGALYWPSGFERHNSGRFGSMSSASMTGVGMPMGGGGGGGYGANDAHGIGAGGGRYLPLGSEDGGGVGTHNHQRRGHLTSARQRSVSLHSSPLGHHGGHGHPHGGQVGLPLDPLDSPNALSMGLVSPGPALRQYVEPGELGGLGPGGGVLVNAQIQEWMSQHAARLLLPRHMRDVADIVLRDPFRPPSALEERRDKRPLSSRNGRMWSLSPPAVLNGRYPAPHVVRVLSDEAFVSELLASLPGVDACAPSIRTVLTALQGNDVDYADVTLKKRPLLTE